MKDVTELYLLRWTWIVVEVTLLIIHPSELAQTVIPTFHWDALSEYRLPQIDSS